MERERVVVIGAGPTGLVSALLLAAQGVASLVLDRREEPHPLPRAVHLDDEVLRLLQGAGVADALRALSRPAQGLRLLDGQHRVLAEFARSAQIGRHGHPQANLFDQPDLEALLRAAVAASPLVELRGGVEVEDVVPGDRPVVRLATGATLHPPAVLACDGATGTTRERIGARWQDLRFTERWLVVDARSQVALPAWDGVHQVCDPRRAATFMRVGEDRYRWEFQLRDGEDAQSLLPDLAAMVAPWTGGRSVEVFRHADYVFRARLADRWSAGRVFLLGDAAHLTPPFVGQGLGAGLRDAANLSWKLARVLAGRAPEALLQTYEAERRPHVRSQIRLALTVGRAMTGGQGPADALRRAAVRGVVRLPGAAARVLDTGSPPLVRGPLAQRPRRPGLLPGTLVPQPEVMTGGGLRRLDDVLGPGFAVLTAVADLEELPRLAALLGGPVVRVDQVLDPGGVLRAWLSRRTAVVVRPDRTVLAAATGSRPGSELLRQGTGTWLPLLTGPIPPSG